MTSGNTALVALGCFGLGLSAGLLILLLASRGAVQFVATLNPWASRIAVAALALVSIALILIPDNDTASPTTSMPSTAGVPAMSGTGTPNGAAGDMNTATQELAARLAANGGSDADWNLLAQSYDFLGRPDDAALARQHKVSAQRSLQDSIAATAPVRPMSVAPASASPLAGTAGLLAQAEQHRRKREFKQACDVYRKVIAANGMTADAWADYADALASGTPNGSLAGEPAKAIEQSLKLDPKHTKALWLKASLAHEERRYTDAVATWRTLQALMPKGSSDARIIEANLAEDQRLAGRKD